MRLGMAIRPLKVSEISHASCKIHHTAERRGRREQQPVDGQQPFPCQILTLRSP